MTDKPCPYIESHEANVRSQCTLVKSPCPCYGYDGQCNIREAYTFGFECGKEYRPKGTPAVCRVFVNGQDITQKVLKRLRPFQRKALVIQACQMNYPFDVDTLEGRVQGKFGDFVIQGVKGELYPCAQDIFMEIHEMPEERALSKPLQRRTNKA